jgi:hypothetical protein
LTTDAQGNLYGTTNGGGGSYCGGIGCGVVFKLSKSGSTWTYTILYNFNTQKGQVGAFPNPGLIENVPGLRNPNMPAGCFYGTAATTYNAQGNINSGGDVFQLCPTSQPGGAWSIKVLHVFSAQSNALDGAWPLAGVTMDASGNLYGTTRNGGLINDGYCVAGCGVIYQLTPPAQQTRQPWPESIVHAFAGPPTDGFQTQGFLTFRGDSLFGSTILGGSAVDICSGTGCGTVFSLTPNGHGGWDEEVVVDFHESNGTGPYDQLTLGQDGHLYGTTLYAPQYGYVFQIP